jgi:hypothetical protein
MNQSVQDMSTRLDCLFASSEPDKAITCPGNVTTAMPCSRHPQYSRARATAERNLTCTGQQCRAYVPVTHHVTGPGPPTPTKKMVKKSRPRNDHHNPPLVWGRGRSAESQNRDETQRGSPRHHLHPHLRPRVAARLPPPLGKSSSREPLPPLPPAPPRPSDLAAPGRGGRGWGRACRGPARAWGSPTRRGRATPAGAPAAGRAAGARAAGGRGAGRRPRAPRRWRPSRRQRCLAPRPGPTRPAIIAPTATPRSKVGGWRCNEQAACFGCGAGF